MRAQPFQFDFEIEAFEKAGPDPSKERRIGGIVSTDHLDRQQEVLLQDGLDFAPFLKGGWFNDNHDGSTAAAVGYPEKAELRTLPDGRKGWYVEGYLLKGHKPADDLWSLATALQKTDRRLGFSVEGAILERDADKRGIVRKAVVREVAITRCPVNEHTQLSVLAKSLSVGVNPPVPGVAAPDAAILAPQALEGVKPRRPSPKKGKKVKAKKRMTKSEAVDFLMKIRPDLSKALAERVVDYAVRWHPAA